MKPYKYVACICMLLFALGISLFADEASTLESLFTKGPESIAYATQFERAVPLAVMHQILDQFAAQLGSFKQVKGGTNPYTLVFDEGTVTAYISLDGLNQVAGLQFTEVIIARLTLADAVKQIIDLDADTAILIRKNTETVVAHHADIPLAVGSAFKLGILAAVEDAVRENRLQWFQSVRLLSMWKSLPTGILQDWPTGSRLTIETLATLMISQSDNTATDALMSLVGRNSVGSYLSNSRPVLSTAEAFRLKNPANSDLLARYRTGSSAEKEKVLDQIKSRPLMEPGLLSGNPVAIDIEWFMTAHELASLIERLQVLPLMTVNAGLATKERWHRVAYKGGSEPGVLNLTTYLEDEDHNRYTVVVTVNNAQSPLDEEFIMETYQAILNTLR